MGFEASASAHVGVIVPLACVHKKLSADNNAAKHVSEFDCDEVEEVTIPMTRLTSTAWR